MKIWLLLVLVLLTGCAEARPKDYAVRLEFATGLSPTLNRVCGGTAVGPNLVLTATHCLRDARVLHIDGKPAQALEIAQDGHDHALIRVDRVFKRWALVRPGAVEGGTVRWVGNPNGEAGVLRRGYVARVTDDEIWIDAQVFGGDSGSGIFSRGGYLRMVVTGVKVWADPRGARLTLVVAYPIRFTRKQWKEIRQ